MAWIESHTDLEGHDKLILFRKRMRWSKNEAIGFLHRFWWMVLKYAPDGVISALPEEIAEDSIDLKADEFRNMLSVLEEFKFLYRSGDKLLVRNWHRYARIYLRDTLWKNEKERFIAFCDIYRVSAEDSRKERGPPAVPTNHNQPTNLPTGSEKFLGKIRQRRNSNDAT